MQIIPIKRLDSIKDFNKIAAVGKPNSNPFQTMFQDAIKNVKTTDSNVNKELYKLTTGQSDDLHNLTIASTKATMSVMVLVQLRNKALDAYNEVMRINM